MDEPGQHPVVGHRVEGIFGPVGHEGRRPDLAGVAARDVVPCEPLVDSRLLIGAHGRRGGVMAAIGEDPRYVALGRRDLIGRK
jgi:hypothetical protein